MNDFVPSTSEDGPTLISGIDSSPCGSDLAKIDGFDGVVFNVDSVVALSTIVGHGQSAGGGTNGSGAQRAVDRNRGCSECLPHPFSDPIVQHL